MRRIGFVFVAALGLSTAANAADLPVPVEEVPFVPTVEAFSWTGPYIGLNLGYAWGGNDDVGLFDSSNGGFQGDVGELEPDGVFGGGQIGYNFQRDWFVGGIEADLQYSGLGDDIDSYTHDGNNGVTYTGRANSDVDYFGTLRGRAGVAFDRFMVYGTGGLAFGNVEYTLTATGGGDSEKIEEDDAVEFGYVVGGGAEFAFTDNLSAKAEYQFIDLGEDDEDEAESGPFSTDPSINFHTVRVGVNYRFNGLFQ